MNTYYITIGIFLNTLGGVFIAFDNVGILQTHLLARTKAQELLATVLHKVFSLNKEFAGEADSVCVVFENRLSLFVADFWIIDGLHFLYLSFGIVVDDEFHGIDNGTHANGAGVEVFATGSLHQFDVVERVKCGIANLVNKSEHCLGAITAAANTADSRHTGVVPAIDNALLR